MTTNKNKTKTYSGEDLRKLREALGMSPLELAQSIGKHVQRVYDAENRMKLPWGWRLFVETYSNVPEARAWLLSKQRAN